MRSEPRDDDHIVGVLSEIAETWGNGQLRHLRLGQLLDVATGDRDLFYVEDDKLIEAIKRLRWPGETSQANQDD